MKFNNFCLFDKVRIMQSDKTLIFIAKAKLKHNDKYDYSKVDFINNRTKIIIHCETHGDFLQTPDSHLSGSGCTPCSKEISRKKRAKPVGVFIQDAKRVHGELYGYLKVNYINSRTPVIIHCQAHGDFLQAPDNHLAGNICHACSGLKKKSTEKFIEDAKLVHGTRYGYLNVDYINAITKVTINCGIHGDFRQIPNSHLAGKGCMKCGGRAKTPQEEFISDSNFIHKGKYDY